jgi:hypothetical protein
MSSNRIGPPGPPSEPQRGSGAADSKKFREELQKIQEVKAVDPDEQSRQKNRFLAMQLGDDDTPDNVNAPPLAASPFDVNFQQDFKTTPSPNPHAPRVDSRKNKISTQKMAAPAPSSRTSESIYSAQNTPIPSPSYSPAPTTNEFYPPSPQESKSSSSLPSSQQFWGTVDLPDTPPSQNIQETSSSQSKSFSNQSNYDRSRVDKDKSTDNDDDDNEDEDTTITTKDIASPQPSQESKGKKTVEPNPELATNVEEPAIQGNKTKIPSARLSNATKEPSLSPFDLVAKTNSSTRTTVASFPEEQAFQNLTPGTPIPDQSLQGGSQERLPLTPLVNPEAEIDLPLNSNPLPQKTASPSFQEQSGTLSSSPTNKGHSSIRPVNSTDGSTEGGSSTKNQTANHASTTIVQPSLPQFPPDVQVLAQAATTHAAPYLRTETMPLFYQMVGNIYIMTAPTGISRTQIVLDTPAFANSKFFGSTITIEKYATAPDSLNIHLTGSDKAVQTFNQNISSLVAAFQNGPFSFRIGRIEASYQTNQANKPVYRRKEKSEGNDSASEDKQQ